MVQPTATMYKYANPPPSSIDDSDSEILAREIPWETYMTARLISDKDWQLIRRYDKRPDPLEELKASLLDEVLIITRWKQGSSQLVAWLQWVPRLQQPWAGSVVLVIDWSVGGSATVGHTPMEASFDLVRLAKPDCKPSYSQLTAVLDQVVALGQVKRPQLPAFMHPVQLKQQAPTQPGRLPSKQEPTLLYLGEILCACLAFRNCSAAAMTAVALKLESSVDSSPAVLLHDTSATPLTSLGPGQRELLPLQLDITEPGTHTLACSAVYTDWQGQRKYFVHFFKFRVLSPLTVRTKVRQPPATAAALASSAAAALSEAAAAAAAAASGGGAGAVPAAATAGKSVGEAVEAAAAAAAPEGVSTEEPPAPNATSSSSSVAQGPHPAAGSSSSSSYPVQGVTRYFLEVTLENSMPQDMSIHGVLVRAAEGVFVLPIAAAAAAPQCHHQHQQQQPPGVLQPTHHSERCDPSDDSATRDQDGMPGMGSTTATSSSNGTGRGEQERLPFAGGSIHKQQQQQAPAGDAGPPSPYVLAAAGGSRTYLWEVCHQTHLSAAMSSDAGGDAAQAASGGTSSSSSSGAGPVKRGLARTSSSASSSSSRMPGVPSPVLGRLEILWEGVAGQCGRLQTQPVLAPASAVKPLHLVLAGLLPGGLDAAAASAALAPGGFMTVMQGFEFDNDSQQHMPRVVQLQERFRVVLDVVLLEPAVLASSGVTASKLSGNSSSGQGSSSSGSQGAAAAGGGGGPQQQVQLVVLSTDLGTPALPHGGPPRHQQLLRLQRRSSTGTGVSGSGCRVFTDGQHQEYSSPGVVVCGQPRVLLAPFGVGQVRQQVVFECMALLPGWQVLPSFVVLAEREGRAFDSLHGVHVLVE